MSAHDIEAEKNRVVRDMHRLLLDLEELEEESQQEPEENERDRIIDLYIPKGLRDIHTRPLRRL
ncbi:MAG: hypothetical protein PHU23_09315 [Dehalococcoidales bacterium]|nr:hypothetical protein [Dehalococcoidales bacterium]